jgi:hypothetical protein
MFPYRPARKAEVQKTINNNKKKMTNEYTSKQSQYGLGGIV